MSSMRIPGRASLGVASLCALSLGASCAGSTEPAVTVSAVTPASAYNDAPVSLVIHGGPFRPAYELDTSGGTATAQLGDFTAFLSRSSGGATRVVPDSVGWLSTSELAAVLHEGVAAGTYDVEVRDPRGQLGQLASGFTSLGPDSMPPAVTIVEPPEGTIVNAEAEVPVAFTADDGLGYLSELRWSVSSSDIETQSGTCPLDPNAQQATCRFFFTVPPPLEAASLPLNVLVEAVDTVGNVGRAQTTLAIGVTPEVTSFSPVEGPAVGGTLVSVVGDDFIVGTQVLVGDTLLAPDGGTFVSSGLIQGTTVAHEPGIYPVSVRTGSATVVAAGTFALVGRPEVLAVSPSSGPPAGGTPITIVGRYFRSLTRLSFGSAMSSAAALCCPSLKSPNRIEGFTPPGAGAVSVFAADAVGGVGQLPLAFTYLPVDDPDAGALGPTPSGCQCPGGGGP
jgi:hypothetical protein